MNVIHSTDSPTAASLTNNQKPCVSRTTLRPPPAVTEASGRRQDASHYLLNTALAISNRKVFL